MTAHRTARRHVRHWSHAAWIVVRPAVVLAAGALCAAMATGSAVAHAASPPAARPEAPNVLLVVVDTLRADHLGPYGWPVPTSPNVARLLAGRGVTVERAHAMAPWTIPSVAALLAGRAPGELLHGDSSGFALPAQGPTIASALQALGYETAAFVGNPVLDAAHGFGRGFATYWRPGGEAAGWTAGSTLSDLARRWLAARTSGRPFFLYVHYVEPHDPYDAPDLLEGKNPFYPAYAGPVNGGWPHGLMTGALRLPDLQRDLTHLTALYDDEVMAVDRAIGELLASVGDEALRHTLVVLTADHGEELYDHGGWKHGRTLYEEVLRVPLLLRWDGVLPAGARSDVDARLIDVAPTVLAAAGGTAPPEWEGESLLPALRGEASPPARPFYAQHLGDGPRRAMAMRDRWKLQLYDRRSRYAPPNRYQAALVRGEGARLPRLALFDLASDPRERSDRASGQPALVASLGAVIHRRLGGELSGVRVLLAGAAPGAVYDVELRLARGAAAWDSYFLGDADQVVVAGDRLRLRLVGEALAKGVLLPAGTRILQVTSAPGLEVRLAGGGVYGGAAVAPRALRAPWPGLAGRPELLLWDPPAAAAAHADDEQLRQLRALGYAG